MTRRTLPLTDHYDVRRGEDGHRYLHPLVRGFPLLRFPLLNKGTAFTEAEREALGLDGLLAPQVDTLDALVERQYAEYAQITEPLDRHVFLRNLQDRNEVLFYALLSAHVEEMLPVVYTPTVGLAVQKFSQIYRYPRGLTLSTRNIDRAESALANVPLNDVRIIVATDSSAILGIGDQGFGGMAISIGKLSLYTVAGGVGPDKTLPVELDVGTGRADLRDDPAYLGVKHGRLTGDEYLRFIDRFVEATLQRYPKAIIQWEDFSKDAAFEVLRRYRRVVPSFNDDIQGTGAVVLAGVLNACRLKGEALRDQVVVVHGAGAGGAGVALAIREGMRREGLSPEEIAARVFVLDSRGLLTDDRRMEDYKRDLATPKALTDGWAGTDLESVIREGKATVLLGLSGQAGIFSEAVVRAAHANTPRPLVFPLSNPTANTEALPADILAWTDGQAIVATGSPFDPVTLNGETHEIGQGNNAFIFPGLGFGAILARVREVTDEMVTAAAYALAEYTQANHPGRTYPPVDELSHASIHVAVAVIRQALADGVATEFTLRGQSDAGLLDTVKRKFWQPKYLPFRPRE
ncbi:NAD-dependent malic enzyme [Deinococcus soli (ex Cha et al. 2016)]|uniref:Malate dehydrogenase (Oxaloacetate-decarboxylating) n=2 Tax=Deinococcus soli (ex Cha et al. 2016) TaxID=1309411 RepID=A0AAE4BLY4_9DEIO|nr:NAD-dependent malic enzyme [Deinococcus soli (ex Cha et al. 2016)]MDR6217927.1 malate dehydrogenase (oxaloacetate-decarboxylating) [Deinococcus soli (ex Cha et al. 2016)]MDR6328177.1 malate dehydrogenase (oxaloacetate-decarboxylating) [Deinococcus soli (ex Cha et al. 2016)]MDR6751029.1 malate dehydrogenase (oxaloacetate-decarboxylating) [Deinococcus soli (ex Cha et al. 2016)]